MVDGMKRVLSGAVFCFVLGSIFSACSDPLTNPAPGSGLLTRDVTIRDTVLYAVSDTTYLQRVALDGLLFSPLSKNLIGKNGNFTALAAIRFFPLSRDTINVISAKLTLRLVSWKGDSSGRFGFTVHKINPSWNQGTATWDTLNASGFFESSVRGSYPETGTVGVGADTQLIVINLDTALVRSWFVSTNNTNYGILLKPKDDCTLIRGIHAFDFDSTKFQPELEVIARGTSATANFDTTKYQVGADVYAANISPFSPQTNRIYTQAGIVYRSLLKFDVSRLPQGAIITAATLSLNRDPALSSINRFTSSPRPIVHAAVATDSTKFEATSSVGTEGVSNLFTFDVRRQVQLWENGTNFGLILRQADANEYGTLDVYSFYSREAAVDSLRPRIAVKYTTFN